MARLNRSFPNQNNISQNRGLPPYLPASAKFDGTTYQTRGTGLTGLADSKKGIIAAQIQLNGSNTAQYFLTDNNVRFEFKRTSGGFLQITGTDSGPSTRLNVSNNTPLSSASGVIQFLASWDLDVPGSGSVYINDALDYSEGIYSSAANLDLAARTNWFTGADASGNNKLVACVGDMYVEFGQYLDFSVTGNRRKFFDAAGALVYKGVDGSVPTGVVPTIYFHLDPSEAAANFAINRGSGGNFSVTAGTLLICGSATAYTQALTAALSFSGSVLKRTGKILSGGLSYVGSYIKQTGKTLSGGLSYVGSQIRRTNKILTGGLSYSGTTNRAISNLQTASLSFSGSLVKRTSKILSGSLSFIGSLLTGSLFSKVLTASLSFSGSLLTGSAFSVVLTAALSFSGSITKRTTKLLSGGLSYVGVQIKRVNTTLASGLSYSGSLVKRINKILTGSLSYAGSLATGSLFFKTLTASLSFSGSIFKRTTKILAGGLSYAGTQIKLVNKTLTGGLSYSGSLIKRTTKLLTGSLSYVGLLVTGSLFFKTLTASLSFSGSLTKRTGKILSGALSYVGSITKRISKTLSSALSFVGNFIAARSGGSHFTQDFTASLSFSGGLTKRISKIFAGSIGFIGSLVLRINRVLSGILIPNVRLGRRSAKIILERRTSKITLYPKR